MANYIQDIYFSLEDAESEKIEVPVSVVPPHTHKHSDLLFLGNDDHPQYLTVERGTALFNNLTIDGSGDSDLSDSFIIADGQIINFDTGGSGDVLTKNASGNWVAATPTGGGGSANIDNGPYSITWSGDTTNGASRNALYDKIASMDTLIGINTTKVSAAGSVTTHSDITSAGSGIIISAAERSAITANTSKVSADGSINTHSDVTITAPSDGEGLVYSAGQWVNTPLPGSGTVTSVGLAATPTGIFNVIGTPVTTTGTITLSLDNQAANIVLAGPTTGAATTPSFRNLVVADIPSLTASKISDFDTEVSNNTDVSANTSNRHASGSDNQNLWATIQSDSGSTTANTQTDTLTIAGGTNVTTAIVGDTLTINATGGGGGSGLVRYQADGTANEEVEVAATGTGITYLRTGTTGTFAFPSPGERLYSARLRLPMGTIGGTTFTIDFETNGGQDGNTSYADMYPPIVQVWREDTGVQVAVSTILAPSADYTRLTINGLAFLQSNIVRLSW